MKRHNKDGEGEEDRWILVHFNMGNLYSVTSQDQTSNQQNTALLPMKPYK